MARKNSRRRKVARYGEIPLLSVSVGVIFFVIQLLFLLFIADLGTSFTGLFTALWLLGGILFVGGVVSMIRDSRWSLLFLAGPAVTFSLFCVLVLLSGLGEMVVTFLAGA